MTEEKCECRCDVCRRPPESCYCITRNANGQKIAEGTPHTCMGDEHARGLYNKYDVKRLNDPEGKHKSCSYFVLDFEHDKFAGPALWAYAKACEEEYPILALHLAQIAREIQAKNTH